jgi:hypothetical protein
MAEFKKGGCTAADAHLNVAYCDLLSGNIVSSRQHLETALKLEPESAPAKKALQDMNAVLARQQPSQPGAPAAANAPADAAGQPVDSHVTSVTWRRSQ